MTIVLSCIHIGAVADQQVQGILEVGVVEEMDRLRAERVAGSRQFPVLLKRLCHGGRSTGGNEVVEPLDIRVIRFGIGQCGHAKEETCQEGEDCAHQ